MVNRINNGEYLSRYGNMEAAERTMYRKRVGEWMQNAVPALTAKAESSGARFQNVIALSVEWNDSECRAFEEGAVLLSALIGNGDTWLPDMLYKKAAGRCINRMVKMLGELQSEDDAETRRIVEPQTAKEVAAAGTGMATQPVADTALAPVRPRHIDQYVHLLPQKTQDRAANYGPLMRELDVMREKERLLMDADGVSAKDREAVAKRIVAIDKEIGSIKKELDYEWDKLAKSGRVVVDDLGNAHVRDIDHSPLTIDHSPFLDEPSGEAERTIDHSHKTELTSEQKHRRRELRKFLTDTRRGNGDTREEHVMKWKECFNEYLTLEPKEKALSDQKIIEAMKHYNILEKRNP